MMQQIPMAATFCTTIPAPECLAQGQGPLITDLIDTKVQVSQGVVDLSALRRVWVPF